MVPPHQRRRILLDADDYLCAYVELACRGGRGGLIRIHWHENLFCDADEQRLPNGGWRKGHRDAWEGKYFRGAGDEFLPDGGAREFRPLWWSAGRFLEVVVRTDEQPLVLERLRLIETRCPLDVQGSFRAGDQRLAVVERLGRRALECCSHETAMDCPYYEQFQYVGDTRLQNLVHYVTEGSTPLALKSLELFASSRLGDGLLHSRYPSRSGQVIPPFALWWVGMVHDHLWWRGDHDRLRRLLPTVRGVLDAWAAGIGPDGLPRPLPGWTFVDWAEGWRNGVPPGGELGPCAPVAWQYALALRQAVELEEVLGEPELAALQRRRADQVGAAIRAAFWDETRGLFADDPGHRAWSEHAQCLALLAGGLPERMGERLADRLFADPSLTRTSIYFVHYLFEVCRKLDHVDRLLERLAPWHELAALGLRTSIEAHEPGRSDCHAWGAHPIYHFRASLLGVRPAAPGFARVEIRPRLGGLAWAAGTIPHPRGPIQVELRQDGTHLRGTVTLPEGLPGALHLPDRSLELQPGRQEW